MNAAEGRLSFHRDLVLAAVVSITLTAVLIAECQGILPPGGFDSGRAAGYAEAVFVAALASSAAVLGVVLAGVAVVVAFLHPKDLAEAYRQDKTALNRYISVFFAPAKIAVVTIPVALVSRAGAYAASTNPEAVVLLSLPAVSVMSYQLTSLWQCIEQVRGALFTVARNPEPEQARTRP